MSWTSSTGESSVQIDVNRLRKLRSQAYEPTELDPGESYIDEFTTKEFHSGHLAELFHENTKHNERTDLKLGPAASAFTKDPSFAYMQARLSPDYEGYERIELPDPETLDVPFSEVVANRRSVREQAGEPFSLEELSTLLEHGCGVTGERTIDEDDGEGTPVRQTFRSYASGGALYPVEVYFVVMNGTDELDRGLYYYNADDHALRVLKRDASLPERSDDLFALPGGVFDPTDSGVVFFLTAAFWRSMAKYGPRGYRYILKEAGHLAQNVLLTATAMEEGALPIAAFKDDPVNDYLEIDGVNEAVVYAICVGKPADGDSDD